MNQSITVAYCLSQNNFRGGGGGYVLPGTPQLVFSFEHTKPDFYFETASVTILFSESFIIHGVR